MTVNEILWSKYGWVSTGDVEQPDPDVVEEALKTRSADDIAETLDTSVRSVSETTAPPPGIKVWGSDGPYLYARHRLYSGSNHFRALDTAQALGLQPLDPPVPTIGQARTVGAWWAAQESLHGREGYALCDAETFAARNAQASRPPLEWTETPALVLIWALLVREGFPPTRVQSYFGLSAQQMLDNLWTPGTWLPTRPSK